MARFVKSEYTRQYKSNMAPLHPGEMLLAEFMEPLHLSVHRLSELTGIHATHLKAVVAKRAALTTEDAFRLARYFSTTIDFWIHLQNTYDVRDFETSAHLMAAVRRIKPHRRVDGCLVVERKKACSAG